MTDAVRSSGVEVSSERLPTPWFLTTPPEPRHVIVRPRVTAMVDAAVGASAVVAVGAPSGYGKTTAAAEWVRTTSDPVAWLSLTPFDRSDGRVADGIVAAVRRGLRDTRALAHLAAVSVDVRDGTTVADALGAVLADLDGGLTLIVDQAEFADALGAGPLAVLARKRLPGLRLLLLAALDADDMLHALGVDGITIGPEELAFDAPEIQTAAHLVTGAACSDAEAEAIHARTEGWPLAVHLQLRAPATGSAADGAGRDVRSGRPRELDDYVDEVILASLPAELATVIRATTVVRTLDPALARALLPDDPDAAVHLDECARRGLFLHRYSDENRRVYAWHGLFRDAVLASEQLRDPRAVTARHLRAAEALREDDPLAAVDHYLAAAQPEQAYAVLRETWLELLQDGRSRALDHACAALPAALADHPAVLSMRASCAWIAGDPTAAHQLMRRGGDAPLAARERAIVDIAVMLTTDDPDRMRDCAVRTHAALDDPQAIGPRLTAPVLFVLGYTAMRLRRSPIDAIGTLRTALREAEVRDKPRLAARAAGSLAFALAFEGKLTEALELATRCATVDDGVDDEWRIYDGGGAAATIGFVAYWRDDLARAREAFADVRRLAVGPTAFEPLARMYDALAAAGSGDLAWQNEALERLREMPADTVLGVTWQGFRDAALARLALARGRGDDAARYARRSLESGEYMPVPRALAAETLRRTGDAATARHIVAETPAAGLTLPARVRLMLTDALLRAQAGRDDAHIMLERCLDLAVHERIIRPFAEPLADLQTLLRSHATWGTRHGGFLADVLVRAEIGTEVAGLSTREREVLAYLRTPMTIAEIAAALFLSTNTVKTHVQSLYRKLNVTNRREAVQLRL